MGMGNEAAGSCYIMVGGMMYENFTSLTLKRSKEEMTCSGQFSLSWPGAEQFNATSPPAQEMVDGAKGMIMLDGQLAGTIRIDKRSSQGSPTSYVLNLSFRGLSSSIVDSSADHPTGQENKKSPGKICKKLMEGYDSKLVDKSGEDKQIERYIIQDGETVERAIRRATTEHGLIACENEKGDVEIAKKGEPAGSSHPLVLGRNFMSWTTDRDMAPRASKVKAKGSSVPTDKKYGKDAEELSGESEDDAVSFKKVYNLLIDSDQDKESLKKRATSEMRRRQAEGLTVKLTMSTWSDDGGQLWKVGTLHQVIIPVDQIGEQLIVKEVEFRMDTEKREAVVTLVPMESFGDSTGQGGDSGQSAGGTKGAFSPSVKSGVGGASKAGAS